MDHARLQGSEGKVAELSRTDTGLYFDKHNKDDFDDIVDSTTATASGIGSTEGPLGTASTIVEQENADAVSDSEKSTE